MHVVNVFWFRGVELECRGLEGLKPPACNPVFCYVKSSIPSIDATHCRVVLFVSPDRVHAIPILLGHDCGDQSDYGDDVDRSGHFATAL